jgi:hypothetical protein
LAENAFRRKGKFWVVRFRGGGENIHAPGRGMEYLYRLLASQGKPLRALDLVLEVSKAPDRLHLGDAGEVIDKDAIRAYRSRHEDLAGELVEAREAGDAEREARTLEEMAFLAKQLADAGFHGTPKRLSSDRRNLQASFTMAVGRAIDEIGKYDPALAEHLMPPILTRGARPMYDPPAPVAWDL